MALAAALGFFLIRQRRLKRSDKLAHPGDGPAPPTEDPRLGAMGLFRVCMVLLISFDLQAGAQLSCPPVMHTRPVKDCQQPWHPGLCAPFCNILTCTSQYLWDCSAQRASIWRAQAMLNLHPCIWHCTSGWDSEGALNYSIGAYSSSSPQEPGCLAYIGFAGYLKHATWVMNNKGLKDL